MNRKTGLTTCLWWILWTLAAPTSADVAGRDDRMEIRQAPVYLQRLAGSVALHTSLNKLVAVEKTACGQEQFFLLQSTLIDEEQFCRDAPYTDQGVAGMCTAFLVAPQVLMTSAHCLREGTPAGPFDMRQTCKSSAWIFDFQGDERGRAPCRIPKRNVYRCAQMKRFHSAVTPSGRQRDSGLVIDDYAFVLLDRPATDRPPLQPARHTPELNAPVFSISHPHGLPLKLASQASLAAAHGNYFRSDLDVSVGSSGGPVFDARNGHVIGLIKGVLYPDGYRELTWRPGLRCRTEYVFPDGHAGDRVVHRAWPQVVEGIPGQNRPDGRLAALIFGNSSL